MDESRFNTLVSVALAASPVLLSLPSDATIFRASSAPTRPTATSVIIPPALTSIQFGQNFPPPTPSHSIPRAPLDITQILHIHFVEVKTHTAKCDICNKRNKSTLQRCIKCGWSICAPCFLAKGSVAEHYVNTGNDWTLEAALKASNAKVSKEGGKGKGRQRRACTKERALPKRKMNERGAGGETEEEESEVKPPKKCRRPVTKIRRGRSSFFNQRPRLLAPAKT